jgi:hypothetical protein
MSEQSFTCDRCGREFPQRQMKEAFEGAGSERSKLELCPECLDTVMNEAGRVRGVPGEEKRAAVVVGDGEPENASFGERETLR